MKTMLKRKLINNLQAYAMITPNLLGFFALSVFPIIMVISWMFFDYTGFGKKEFIGLENFIRLFTRDRYYWVALYNTFIIAFGKLLIEIPLALLLAVLLNSRIKFANTYRALFFMPVIVSVAITALIFSILFASYEGIINEILKNLHIIQQPVNWFGNVWTSRLVLGLASIWEGYGINMVLFLMALQSIPASLYECAEIDGAGKVRQFFNITIPMIGPIAQFVLLTAILSSLRMTDLALVLTNGHPQGKTEVAMTYTFKYFFSYGVDRVTQLGYGSALAIVTALVLGLLTLIYFRFTKNVSSIY